MSKESQNLNVLFINDLRFCKFRFSTGIFELKNINVYFRILRNDKNDSQFKV